MLYHASPTGGLTVLTPHVSNHGHPLVYFSKKRENVLVYLSRMSSNSILMVSPAPFLTVPSELVATIM